MQTFGSKTMVQPNAVARKAFNAGTEYTFEGIFRDHLLGVGEMGGGNSIALRKCGPRWPAFKPFALSATVVLQSNGHFRLCNMEIYVATPNRDG
jgi:hypothetical protein